eukprot:6180580-Pleurochrysis_carterae.AAC.1
MEMLSTAEVARVAGEDVGTESASISVPLSEGVLADIVHGLPRAVMRACGNKGRARKTARARGHACARTPLNTRAPAHLHASVRVCACACGYECTCVWGV